MPEARWRPRKDSNLRHTVPETVALSPELRGRDAQHDSDRSARSSSRYHLDSMADPLALVAELLSPAFAQVAGRQVGDVDPVVRPSDRADAQANGALGLAKQLGTNPREVATA